MMENCSTNWQTNFNPFNTDINTVRGQETGYCTFNPLKKVQITLSNGNLDLSSSNTSNKCKGEIGTFICVSTGKYYYEVTIGTN